jgi:hypothetical protein
MEMMTEKWSAVTGIRTRDLCRESLRSFPLGHRPPEYLFLSSLLACILFKCSCSLEGFMTSFEKFFWQVKHIGKNWFAGEYVNPYFKYSILYCRHFFFASDILKYKICNNDFSTYHSQIWIIIKVCLYLRIHAHTLQNKTSEL